MKSMLPLLLLATLGACIEETSPKDGERAAAEISTEDDAEALKAEQKSIEEAADAAAKLVEEETREEIEQIKEESSQQP
jgi:cytidylate kinase